MYICGHLSTNKTAKRPPLVGTSSARPSEPLKTVRYLPSRSQEKKYLSCPHPSAMHAAARSRLSVSSRPEDLLQIQTRYWLTNIFWEPSCLSSSPRPLLSALVHRTREELRCCAGPWPWPAVLATDIIVGADAVLVWGARKLRRTAAMAGLDAGAVLVWGARKLHRTAAMAGLEAAHTLGAQPCRSRAEARFRCATAMAGLEASRNWGPHP
jgi:hypothetical protein